MILPKIAVAAVIGAVMGAAPLWPTTAGRSMLDGCPGCNNANAHDDGNGAFEISEEPSLELVAGDCKAGSSPPPDCERDDPCSVTGVVTIKNNANFNVQVTRFNGDVVIIKAGQQESFNVTAFDNPEEYVCGDSAIIAISKTSGGSSVGELRWNCDPCPAEISDPVE